ncbi:glycerophosphodiester phosphodiesterase [Tamlana fucoidanivorans]|uniref:Glycerophosphodiester phosphodiesterase n=1 Tax=Allotamlana fucoidanivorans TaxID=2583814 RepID=A0A5C4SKE2_9FLAO|nr:glycerophosphodiester phosphodiesterase family protein [Tamlana fucoidanivorans]TNJ43863.1 glycerophosphodiester phosphodiesterase [Tamlana fucoidanivorans]
MTQKYLKIGHRGAKGHLAENTIESITKALEYHVDGIEIDVHRCATGELVVFHDFTLDRMTNGTGEMAAHSFEALRKLKIDTYYQIPTLEEVLNLLCNSCLLNIELKGKNTAEGTVQIIKDAVKGKKWSYNNIIVSSFQHHELEHVFKHDKNILLGVLTKANMDEALEFAKTVNAVAIHPNVALVTRSNVKRVQELGYSVNVWTANEKATIERMKKYGVDGIISDYPDRL